VKEAANSVKDAAQDAKHNRDINLHQERRIPDLEVIDAEVIGTSETPLGKPIAPPAPPIPAPIERERVVIEPPTPLDAALPVDRPKVDFDKI
jgi:stress response protein YsnF